MARASHMRSIASREALEEGMPVEVNVHGRLAMQVSRLWSFAYGATSHQEYTAVYQHQPDLSSSVNTLTFRSISVS
jgi:hypothetical protein